MTSFIEWIARKHAKTIQRKVSINVKSTSENCIWRIWTIGLLTVYVVNKIQFRLKLYFELFDFFVNIRQNLHNCAKSCKGIKIALTPPPPLQYYL